MLYNQKPFVSSLRAAQVIKELDGGEAGTHESYHQTGKGWCGQAIGPISDDQER